MQVERLETSAYLTTGRAEGYTDNSNLHSLYEKLAFRGNLLLVGPKGTGKSLSIAAFCEKKGYPTITFDCSEDVRRSQLVGMFILRGNETPFILGPLTSAIDVANEVGECVLVLEEINALSPQAQKLLNPLTDFRVRIEVPEAKKVFSLREGARLWILGTMNSSSYGGVYQLNEDLKSRFRMLPIPYPKPDVEKKILEGVVKANAPIVDPKFLDRILTLAKETRQGKMEYALSTRDLVQLIQDAAELGIDTALLLLMGKYEELDRSVVSERIYSIFGIKPSQIKL